MSSFFSKVLAEKYLGGVFVAAGLLAIGLVAYHFIEVHGDANWVVKALMAVFVLLTASMYYIVLSVQKVQKELRARNKELEDSEDRLTEAQAIANIGSWRLYQVGNVMEWSNEMFSIFGYDIREGEPELDDFNRGFTLESLRDLKRSVKRSYMLNKAFHKVVQYRPKPEVLKWVDIRGEPIWDGHHNVIGVQGTCQDITERKNLERELQEKQTLTYHQSKLAAIGQLAAGVGHEVNNPLAIIDGHVTNLELHMKKDGVLTEAYLGKIQRIQKAVQRIAKIVQGLKTYSRSDSSEKELCSLKEIVDESIGMVEEIYQSENVSIEYNSRGQSEDAFKVLASYGRLQQVIMNLLNNAKDAMSEKDQRLIYVDLTSNHDSVTLKVKDTGRGIPESAKDSIFNPFFTTKNVNKGTGLGLAIVNAIVKDHEGHIEVESVEGQGAEFSVRLPRAS